MNSCRQSCKYVYRKSFVLLPFSSLTGFTLARLTLWLAVVPEPHWLHGMYGRLSLCDGPNDAGRRPPPESEDNRSRRCSWCEVTWVFKGSFPCIPRPNQTRALVARPVFWKRALHLLGEGHQSTAARRWTLNFTQKYAIVLDKDALVKITQVITPWLNRHLADVKGWFNLGRPRYSEVNYSIVGFKPTETIWRLNLWFVPSQNAERLSSSYSLTWSFPHSLTCNVL